MLGNFDAGEVRLFDLPLEGILNLSEEPAIIAVDVPIGLPEVTRPGVGPVTGSRADCLDRAVHRYFRRWDGSAFRSTTENRQASSVWMAVELGSVCSPGDPKRVARETLSRASRRELPASANRLLLHTASRPLRLRDGAVSCGRGEKTPGGVFGCSARGTSALIWRISRRGSSLRRGPLL